MSAVLSVKDLCLRYSLQEVLTAATFAVEEGEKVGLVGRNGSGKSSLLKILAGKDRPDSGLVSTRNGLVIGYLSQEFTLRDDATVSENIRDGAVHVLKLMERYESGNFKGEAESALLEQINLLGGWDLDARISTAMNEIGTAPADTVVRHLSGGEKRRVALCRSLVSNPDLLLLDEPTNHLDAESIVWLEEFLKEFRGACLFVTHDRYFLDRIAQRILELDNGRLYSHPGSYRDYLLAKQDRLSADQAREDRRQKFLRSELEFVRAGVKARRTKSRERVEKYYEVAAQAGPTQEMDIELLIPPPPPLANVVVETKDAAFAWGERTLFENLTISFEPGTVTGIVGRNGTGKTTLLRTLMGMNPPTGGVVTVGKRTVFNYVDQHRLTLDDQNSVLQEIGGNSDFVTFGDQKLHVRTYLKRFLFTDERVQMKIDRLSGGERSRLLLAKILIRGGNFLVLDEPTNDLDLQTLNILEEALLDFPGVAVVVSHDRFFLDRVCDRLLVFEGPGSLHLCAGNYSYYQGKLSQRKFANKPAMAPDPANAPQPATEAKEKPRKLTWKEQRELEGMENTIAAEEATLSEIENKLADPAFYSTHGAEITEFVRKTETLRTKITALYARWEELEAVANAK